MNLESTTKLPSRSSLHIALTAVCLLLLAGGCAEKQPAATTGKLRVAAGILPYADIVKQIGGDRVEVNSIIPPGTDPHTFDLDPRRMMKVAKADLVVFNGAGLEMWGDRIAENLTGTSRILWVDRIIHDSLLTSPDDGDHAHRAHDGHDHHGGVNPHFWLDPVLMKVAVGKIIEVLVQIDPKHEEEYRARSSTYIARLDSLDQGIRRNVAEWKSRAFVTTHPAWLYFCRRYGLREADILEAGPGKEISAKQMAAVAKRMRSEGLNVIFAQYMFPDAVAKALAKETGATLAELDPNGSKNTALHYIELMKYNVDIMNAAMK